MGTGGAASLEPPGSISARLVCTIFHNLARVDQPQPTAISRRGGVGSHSLNPVDFWPMILLKSPQESVVEEVGRDGKKAL